MRIGDAVDVSESPELNGPCNDCANLPAVDQAEDAL